MFVIMTHESPIQENKQVRITIALQTILGPQNNLLSGTKKATEPEWNSCPHQSCKKWSDTPRAELSNFKYSREIIS